MSTEHNEVDWTRTHNQKIGSFALQRDGPQTQCMNSTRGGLRCGRHNAHPMVTSSLASPTAAEMEREHATVKACVARPSSEAKSARFITTRPSGSCGTREIILKPSTPRGVLLEECCYAANELPVLGAPRLSSTLLSPPELYILFQPEARFSVWSRSNCGTKQRMWPGQTSI